MAELILYHHAQGLTPGVHNFAESLREAEHVVHTPDLYDSETFVDVSSGVAHAKEIGFDVIIQRGVAAAAELPNSLVYAGFSLGVLPAQKLAQTRPDSARCSGRAVLSRRFPDQEVRIAVASRSPAAAACDGRRRLG